MGKRGATKQVSRAVLALTDGLFSHMVDVALWFAVYMAELSVPFKMYGNAWRAQATADRVLDHVNYQALKRAIKEARKKGWLKKANRRGAPPEITAAGKRRLIRIVPTYDEKRVWDGRMHLITYDIPEKRRKERGVLREYLQRIGCGRLQDSVWMTPYNPIDTIRRFITERNLGGTILISDLGKDGSIGEEDLGSLIVSVYKLDALNDRYIEWLDDIDDTGVTHWSVMRYLSILRDDPQLPFALLPKWWKGDQAYQRVKERLGKVSIF